MEWKWSVGGPYEKSPRIKHKANAKANDNANANTQIEDPKRNERNVLSQCLLSDEEIWSLEQRQLQEAGAIVEPNRREDTYNRMSQREMMGQIGMNPFFTNDNMNYVNDVMTQENFMRPMSTSVEKEKEMGLQ